MEVVRDINSITRVPDTVLTVGTFDGIHLGHQYILQAVKARAQTDSLQTALVTFEPHPKMVVQAESGFRLKLLTTIEEKIELLQRYELDRLVVIPFDKRFAATSSKAFLTEILLEKIGFRHIIIGHDHAFGKDRAGNIETIEEVADSFGFSFESLSAHTVSDVVISSTKIRDFLRTGDIVSANRALGRCYTFDSKVTRGVGRGKKLGFPTANLDLVNPDKMIPGNGVYAVHVGYRNQMLAGMMNVGNRPTFGASEQTVEVFIMDFDADIYESKLRVHVIDRIRSERKFKNVDSLVAQLNSDKERCLSILNSDKEVQCP